MIIYWDQDQLGRNCLCSFHWQQCNSFSTSLPSIQCLPDYLFLSLEAIYLKSVSKLDLELEVDIRSSIYCVSSVLHCQVWLWNGFWGLVQTLENDRKWMGKVSNLCQLFSPHMPLRQWQYCTSYRMIYFLYEVNCCFLSILLHKYLILFFFTSYSREIIIRN